MFLCRPRLRQLPRGIHSIFLIADCNCWLSEDLLDSLPRFNIPRLHVGSNQVCLWINLVCHSPRPCQNRSPRQVELQLHHYFSNNLLAILFNIIFQHLGIIVCNERAQVCQVINESVSPFSNQNKLNEESVRIMYMHSYHTTKFLPLNATKGSANTQSSS
jgi:hypothetical protein